MKNSGVNGCGCGSGILKYFKPPYATLFKNQCNAHDLAYDAGKTEDDRKHADLWLYRNMFAETYNYKFSPAKTTYLVVIALLYYISVRAFGWHYFNFKK